MTRQRGGRRLYAEMTERQRAKARQHYPELLAAATAAVLDGFSRVDLHELVYAPARGMGVWVWPGYADAIARDAWESIPEAYRPRV